MRFINSFSSFSRNFDRDEEVVQQMCRARHLKEREIHILNYGVYTRFLHETPVTPQDKLRQWAQMKNYMGFTTKMTITNYFTKPSDRRLATSGEFLPYSASVSFDTPVCRQVCR